MQTIVYPRRRGKYGKICRTMKGDIVKSIGEKQIADFLYLHGIKYKYEDVLTLYKHKIRPDFHLLNDDIYLEYWGLLSIKKYRFFMFLKKKIYHKSHTHIIDIYPNNLDNLEKIFYARCNEQRHKNTF